VTWFEDLSPYTYLQQPARGSGPVLNIGWLEQGQPFPRGPTPAVLIVRLRLLVEHAEVNITRGWHFCDLCPRAGEDGAHGHGEIWAVGSDGTRFAAPSLIAHYVETHAYQPPRDFIAAVLRVASLSVDEATTKDLCLTCGSPLVETGRCDARRGSDMAPGVARSLACNGCGCDYDRWSPLPGAAR
jgi:hypothetical protein